MFPTWETPDPTKLQTPEPSPFCLGFVGFESVRGKVTPLFPLKLREPRGALDVSLQRGQNRLFT